MLVALAVFAGAARATTIPGTVAKVPVKLGPASVSIKRDQYTKGKVSRYPRGAIVDFQLKNTSKRTIRVQIEATSKLAFFGASHVSKITRAPHALAPGQSSIFQVYFFFRASFALQELVGGKVVASAPVTVF
jgi:hypothetical protein